MWLIDAAPPPAMDSNRLRRTPIRASESFLYPIQNRVDRSPRLSERPSAAVAAFVLELMGGVEVRNYYRSWAEWGNDSETPIVKPEKK